MTKRLGRQIRAKGLSFYAKIKYLNGKVTSRRSPIKRKVFNFLPKDTNGIKWIYIKITYKLGINNEGKYYDIKEMLNAWYAFTEEGFIKEILEDY